MKCTKKTYCTRHKSTTRIKLTVIAYLLAFYVATIGVCIDRQCLAEPQIISPVVASSQLAVVVDSKSTGESAKPSPVLAKTEEQEGEETDSPSQQEIEDYVRVIFGRDSRVAIAVSKNECNPKHRDYPKCVLHTEHEYSVGIFQINLYNSRHWIHAQKVPGETMEEKIEWLKDPYHNTLVAFKIFSDSKGFSPWSAYTSGNYLKDL